MRSGYKHYQNRGQAGDRIFVTTTTLDFVEVFKKHTLAGCLTELVFESHAAAGAKLHAFAVMSHHVHFLTTLPEGMKASQFVGEFKSRSARAIRPMLVPEIEVKFDMQRGLDRRQFWQRSFRSYTILRENDFHQKVRYIHLNPVRAGLCENAEAYRWSSASLVGAELWQPDVGISYDDWRRNAPTLLP